MRRVWTAACWAIGSSAMALGCQQEQRAPRPPGLVDQDGTRAPVPSGAGVPKPEGAATAPLFDDLTPFAPGAPKSGPASASTAQVEAHEPRDLAEELLALFPEPPECLDLGQLPAGLKQLVVTAEATIMPSGRVSRVSVSVPGQPAQTQRCIEAFIGRGMLKADVPNAPVSARASQSLEIAAQENSTPKGLPTPTFPSLPADVAQPENGDVAKPDGTTIAN